MSAETIERYAPWSQVYLRAPAGPLSVAVRLYDHKGQRLQIGAADTLTLALTATRQSVATLIGAAAVGTLVGGIMSDAILGATVQVYLASGTADGSYDMPVVLGEMLFLGHIPYDVRKHYQPLPVASTFGGSIGGVTIADGGDTAEGAIADAAVVGDASGSVSAKLRGINKALAVGLPMPAGYAKGPPVAVTVPSTGNAIKALHHRSPNSIGYVFNAIPSAPDIWVYERKVNAVATPEKTDISSGSPGLSVMYFEAPHGFAKGDMVTVSVSGGGLTAGTIYYAGPFASDYSTASTLSLVLYDSATHAAAGTSTGVIPLTAAITVPLTSVVRYARPSATDVANNVLTFAAAHGYKTGDMVIPDVTEANGLTANQVSFVRVGDQTGANPTTKLMLFDTAAHAGAAYGTTTGVRTFTAVIFAALAYVEVITSSNIQRGTRLSGSVTWDDAAGANIDLYLLAASGTPVVEFFEVFAA